MRIILMCVMALMLQAHAVAAQTVQYEHEVDLVAGEGSGLYVHLGLYGGHTVIGINTAASLSSLPIETLIQIGAKPTDQVVHLRHQSGDIETMVVYRLGPIYLGNCKILTAYFSGNAGRQAWIGLNLLEYLGSYGFTLSSNRKMHFSCPKEA